MARLSNRELSASLAPDGFIPQIEQGDIFLIRRAEHARLYECIEISFAGRRSEALHPGISVRALRLVELQFRGLFLRDTLTELCTDPSNGRVEFETASGWQGWLGQFARVAPSRVRELARARGPELLEQTKDAFEAADSTFRAWRESLMHPNLEDRLSRAERARFNLVINTPYMSGPPRYEYEHRAAVAALILQGDQELLRLASNEVFERKDVETFDKRLAPLKEAVWRVRFLVDLMVEHRAAARSGV